MAERTTEEQVVPTKKDYEETNGEQLVPLLSAEGGYENEDTDIIQRTLHNCRADIEDKLNFNVIYSHLGKAEIIPVEATPYLVRPLPPDNTGAQINNLMILLQGCTQKQFKDFIRLLRETAPKAGNAHEELADTLDECFNELMKSGIKPKDAIGAKRKVSFRMTNIHDLPMISELFRAEQPPASIGARCCGFYQKWKHFKKWVICYAVCLFLIVVPTISPVFFLPQLLDIDASKFTPTLVYNRSITEIDVGGHSNWLLELNINVNCSGSILVLSDTNCEFLEDMKMSIEYSPWLGNQPIYYFLDDSEMWIQYYNKKFHNFIIMKSLHTYQRYLKLCHDLNDVSPLNKYCMNDKTILHICNGSYSDWKDDTWCFLQSKGTDFLVNHSDFYSLAVNSGGNPYVYITQYFYNDSALYSKNGIEEYKISENGHASFTLSNKFSFKEKDHCILLNTTCVDDNDKEGFGVVHYAIRRRKDHVTFFMFFLGLILLIFCIILLIHFYYLYKKDRRTSS